MNRTVLQPRTVGPAIVGLLLIALGAAALAMRQAGVDLFALIGDRGWPLFIIAPGVVLLAASVVPAPPRGIGFAIAGSIVTTVGALLLYQSRSDDWESWAYAWALIPLAAGLAMIAYGLFARVRGLVTGGLWTAGISAIVLTVGAWYFEGVFAGQSRPTDLASFWPVMAIGVGVVITLRSLLDRRGSGPSQGDTQPEGPTTR